MTDVPQEAQDMQEGAPPRETRAIYYYVGRYGVISSVTTFTSTIEDLHPGDRAVAKTERGVEIIDIISRFDDPGKLPTRTPFSKILRRPSHDDEVELERIQATCIPAEFEFASQKIRDFKLPMRLTYIEHLLRSDRIIFYFLADARVDFRELVRELAGEFQTRIELKQVGVRDQARILSDFEHCGRELCCRTFIQRLQPVSMKMAKNQKATLDPSKISGACGRLMCCLRYEDKVYSELMKNIPKKGSIVETPKLSGRVVDFDVIAQKVTVEQENRVRTEVSVSDITATYRKGQAPATGRKPQREAPSTCFAPAEKPETGDAGIGGESRAASEKGAPRKRRRRRKNRRNSGPSSSHETDKRRAKPGDPQGDKP